MMGEIKAFSALEDSLSWILKEIYLLLLILKLPIVLVCLWKIEFFSLLLNRPIDYT